MPKRDDPNGIEDRLYQKWLDKKYFHAEVDHSKTPFTIVIPPPNITGQLHMGHGTLELMTMYDKYFTDHELRTLPYFAPDSGVQERWAALAREAAAAQMCIRDRRRDKRRAYRCRL